jgi:formylglycine-generating enzyme required for sulfatase activity
VTNAQYAEFLNAKASTDSHGLYNSSMSSYGITRNGSSGSYTYAVTSGMENRPVVYVSWFDAARFSNWLSNGQGNSDTEIGSYNLNGASSGLILPIADAKIRLPSEDEWYKAYGTFDQGGNVWEWNDAIISSSSRGLRGGSWDYIGPRDILHSSFRYLNSPSNENAGIGFRLASIVPEPTSMLLSMFAGGMMLIRRKR